MEDYLNILIVTTSYPRFKDDDAGVFVQRLVQSLSDKGCGGRVLCPYDPLFSLQTEGNFTIAPVKYGFFSSSKLCYGSGILPNIKSKPYLMLQIPSLIIGFIKAIVKNRPQVILANWFFSAIPSLLSRFFLKAPLILVLRGSDFKLLDSNLLKYPAIFVLNKVDCIVTVNKTFKQRLNTLGVRSKTYYIPNGINVISCSHQDVISVKNEILKGEDYKILLFVGTVTERKGVRDLIDIIEKLPNHILLVIGRLTDKAYFQLLEEKIKAKKFQDRVIFKGVIPPDKVFIYYKVADLYVSMSQYEGRPNAVLEAMGSGLPAVLSNISAHKEIIEESKGGLLASNVDQAISQIEKVLYNKDLYIDLQAKAKDYAKQFSWSNTASAYLNIILDLTDDKRHS